MVNPSFDEVVAFVRESRRIRKDRSITPETRLEADLGITGDDGVDLLEEAEKHFKLRLTSDEHGVRETFNLKPNEYLFESEGFDPLGITTLIRWLRGEPRPVVRDLTVGELHKALGRAASKENEKPSASSH